MLESGRGISNGRLGLRSWAGALGAMAIWCLWYLSTLYVGSIVAIHVYGGIFGVFDVPNWSDKILPYSMESVGRLIGIFVAVPALVAGGVVGNGLRRGADDRMQVIKAWLIVTFLLEGLLCLLFFSLLAGGFIILAQEVRMHPSAGYIVGFECLSVIAFPIASYILTATGYWVARFCVYGPEYG